MKGSVALPARPSDDAGLLRFLTTDYTWMVRDGILPNTAGNWRAFDQGYRVSDARLTPPVRAGYGQRNISYEAGAGRKTTGRACARPVSLPPVTFRLSESRTFRDPAAPACRVPETAACLEPAPSSCGARSSSNA